MSIKNAVGKMLPQRIRELVWYVTDEDYRRATIEVRTLHRKQTLAGRQIAAQTNGYILTGPFAGMQYPSHGGYPQKLLGTYELELHHVLREISSNDYGQVIDIGAGEGYYVCGCARLFSGASVVAFEANGKLHPTIRNLAKLNCVLDRVAIEGICTLDLLAESFDDSGKVLLICDAEGAENELLIPGELPQLKHTDIIVEVHDHIRDGTSQRLRRRFEDSHLIEQISCNPRSLVDFPKVVELTHDLMIASMDERRDPRNQWFWMTSQCVTDGP